MKLRIWIPCILLIVILIMLFRTYMTEGFQSGASYTPPVAQSADQTRINFWLILGQDKAGLPITPGSSGSGSKRGSSSGSASLLAQVMNPGPKDTFTIVYPKYLSMYSLAKYGFDPVVARSALINDYDTLQGELQTVVELEQGIRASFAANPKGESCNQINTMTMAFYGRLLSIYNSAQDLSGAAYIAGNLHDENMNLQNSVSSGSNSPCMNQGATPSAACIQLASMDEKLFPLLPKFDAMNLKLLTSGQDIQAIIDTLVQAYLGMGCTRGSGSGSGSPLSIDTVFSSAYLESLPTVDTDTLNTKLQELSPYYVSPNIINFISRKLVGTSEFSADLSTSLDYLKDMNKVVNSIVSLNTDIKPIAAGEFYNESGASAGGFTNCPGGYYCTLTSSMPIQCPVGTFCPPGTTDQPIQCPPGLYSPAGSDDISKCIAAFPLGYYQDSTTGKLIECPTGSYCSNGARTECPPGTYNMKKGKSDSTACLDCPKGAYCTGPTSITPCPAGTYNSSTRQGNKSACISCPAGTFCVNKGSVTPTPCPAGTFSSTAGRTTACNPVEAGYYLPGTGKSDDSGKLQCTAGYYCPGGSGNPVSCTLGNYCDVPQLSAPKPCAAGQYGSTFGLTTPSCSGSCSAGYLCPPGTSVMNAFTCPAGSYCPAGTVNAILCAAGYYCPYGSASQIPCPEGTYNDATGKSSLSDCKICDPGKVCNLATSTLPPPCPAGYYCPGGTAPLQCIPGAYCDETSLSAPKLCAAGTYNPKTGSTSILDCKACAPGTWSSSLGEQGSCSQTCPPGNYCPSPRSSMLYTIPTSALPIYYGVQVSGRVTLQLGSTSPVPCPFNTYCDSSGMANPTPCPTRTFSAQTGQTSVTVCQ